MLPITPNDRGLLAAAPVVRGGYLYFLHVPDQLLHLLQQLRKQEKLSTQLPASKSVKIFFSLESSSV